MPVGVQLTAVKRRPLLDSISALQPMPGSGPFTRQVGRPEPPKQNPTLR
jgi:hypothetical protein